MFRKIYQQILPIIFTTTILAVFSTPVVAVSLKTIENNTEEETPTEQPSPMKTISPISTEEYRWEQKVERIGDLEGKWAKGAKVLEIQVISEASLNWGAGVVRIHGLPIPGGFGWDCDAVEWFQFDKGRLTWGDPSFPCASSVWLTWGYEQNWIKNPHATYEVYIIKEGNQPLALRFTSVMQDDDQIQVRQEYLSGAMFKWVGELKP